MSHDRVPDKPVHSTHDTPDGAVHARVVKSRGKWIARIWGANLDGRREFPTQREANRYALHIIRELYPNHRCTDRCRLY